MYVINKPRKMVSLPLKTILLGCSCSREIKNLNANLNTAMTENTNTKRYMVSKLVILIVFSCLQDFTS